MADSKRAAAAAASGAQEEILTLAHRLNLTALPLALSELLQKAQDQGASYSELALWLLRAEVQARGARSTQRNFKRSRLGRIEGLEGFDFSLRPKLPARVVGELMHCRWVGEHRNIICVGRPGTGKTRIVKALGQAAVLQGHRVLYVQTAHMLADLHAALADHSFQRVLRRYLKPAVLILEEFGYQDFGPQQVNYLFQVVSARHQTAATLVAANTGFGHWKRFFPSEAQAVATVDRLIDDATILRFTGKSFRNPRDIHGDKIEGEDD